jgi:hypothetical protein
VVGGIFRYRKYSRGLAFDMRIFLAINGRIDSASTMRLFEGEPNSVQ